jgi:methionine-gamma-lyase
MKYHFETDAVHGVHQRDPLTGALSMPIYQTSTFVFKDCEQGARRFKGEEDGYIYSRLGNPNSDVLGKKVAKLEGFEAGMCTGSGMAAVSNVILATAQAGDHIIVDDTVYGGTHYLIEDEIRRVGIEVTRVDAACPEHVARAMKPNTTLVLIETPANPTLKLIDIEAVAQIAHQGKALVCVDNTFLTPFYQSPKELGADIVLHSATKCLKTLALRVERSSRNATKIAQWLEQHPGVERVYYPFLESHPQYDLAKRQQSGGGGIISFEMKGGYNAGKALMDHVKLCTLAVSLGDCDTLIQHPASMTHAGM